jgi:hypothetical protein
MSNETGSGWAPAQWYPDPAGSGRLRWWNGHAWTEHYAPAQPVAYGQHGQYGPYGQHGAYSQDGAQQQGAYGQAAYGQGGVHQQGAYGQQPAYAQQPAYPAQAGYPVAGEPVQGAGPQGAGAAGGAPAYDYRSYLQAAPPAHQPVERPRIEADARVYNPFIWLIVLLPLALSLFELFWQPTVSFVYEGSVGHKVPVMDPDTTLAISSGVILVSWLLFAAIVVLAYFDWRELGRIGVVQPFHWAWAFLLGSAYAIGRSVIVRRVAPSRGLAPLWVWIAVTAFALIVGVVKIVELVTALVGTLPPNA